MSGSEKAKIVTLERFKLGKGFTREAEQGIWTKEYLEIEVKLPENATNQDFVANFTATEYMIDQLLQAPATAAPTERPKAPQPKITITPEEIDKLPWIASNWVRKGDKDRNAKPLEDAWIKLENSASWLIRMIDEAPDGKLSLPPYEFEFKTFADSSTKLIVRWGPKEEKKA